MKSFESIVLIIVLLIGLALFVTGVQGHSGELSAAGLVFSVLSLMGLYRSPKLG